IYVVRSQTSEGGPPWLAHEFGLLLRGRIVTTFPDDRKWNERPTCWCWRKRSKSSQTVNFWDLAQFPWEINWPSEGVQSSSRTRNSATLRPLKVEAGGTRSRPKEKCINPD